MTKIKYDISLIEFIRLFDQITRTNVKDCFEDQNGLLIFVVELGEIGKAVGKKGSNVKIVENRLNRKIKIVEFNPQKLSFIANYIYPLKAVHITEEDGIVTIKGPDVQTKGLLIGRNAQNLRNLERVVRRYFEVKEIKVV